LGLAHHDNGRQRCGLRQEQMVHRDHHLLGIQPELHGNFFQGIDRRAVHIRLAGFAQASIAHRHVKTR
jgi:hypothetical protein